MPGELQPQKSNLLTTLCGIGKQYFISLEFFATKFEHNWADLIHLTQGNHSSRLPAVWAMSGKQIWIQSEVNGKWNFESRVGTNLTPQTWNKLEIEQVYEDGKV